VQGSDGDADDYVPRNMPAIGDLFDLFHFDKDRDDRGGDDRGDHRAIGCRLLSSSRPNSGLPEFGAV
jgi:hypothetical protein